ncbi:nuclear pore complex protein Nup160 [Spea bombifrons]|uniref:nuclear pore complex protein Nup160 n=1 Tax=Spea bombifrons TaxID=233779 RepID=UPI002348F685|nr:nuclear pore complex protein Nup160 [Spea bombifrons]
MAASVVLERSFTELTGVEWGFQRNFRDVTIRPDVSPVIGGPKYSESAGGYCYKESGSLLSATRNRFLHWTSYDDTLELVEESLDINLLNNAIRLKILNCCILPGGVHVCETHSNMIIMIVTNQTVHRLTLSHPSRMYRGEIITESQMQSIFTDIGKGSFGDPSNSYVIPAIPGRAQSSSASTAWLSSDGEALFAFPSTSGGIFVIKMPPYDVEGLVTTQELKQTSVMQRFLTGWMPTSIRGDQGPAHLPVSLAVHCLEHDAFLFALCQDHKLRMWSYKDQMCLMVADMLEFVPVTKDLRQTAGTGHRLRLAHSTSLGLYLGVYLHSPKQGQFCIFQLVSAESNRYSLDHVSSIFANKETLVDFTFTLTSTDIWALWLDEENQTTVKHINFEHNQAGQWNQVFVNPLPEEELSIGDEQDPRETYFECLFAPGRFTAGALLKALQIMQRGSGKVLDQSWEGLKKEVTLTVENELRSNLTEYEMSQEEFRQLQAEYWSKFYTCCLQYQEALSRPLALLVHPHTAMVCLMRKGFLSFLAPSPLVDHLYLLPPEQLLTVDESVISDDMDVASDTISLMQCLRMIGDYISPDMAFLMESACCHLQPPERVAEQILEDMIANDMDNIMEDIHNKFQDIRNPFQCIMYLLQEMDYETSINIDKTIDLAQPLNVRMNLSSLYGSITAASLVCQAVGKISTTRFMICRDLLILQHLLLRMGDMAFAGGGQLLQSQQDLIPRTSQMLLSYYVIRWGCQCLATSVPVDILESNLQHLSVLELSDSPAFTPAHKYASSPQTVIELFFQDVARKRLSHLFSHTGITQAHSPLSWTQLITDITNYLLKHLWPSNPGFLFPECLMRNFQYTQLQEYVQLLQPWCQVNVGSCHFMMGQCYLVTGEGHKALECFCQAASEVEREEFLERLIRVEDGEPTSTRLQYYNRVLRLLEDIGLPELVIQLSTLAITEAADDWRSQAALRTRIFKHHLDLGHNSQAYDALTQIPDPSRQLDCLRQLVVVLCERLQLQDLVEFPYVNLHNEVVGIIESRARAVDLMTHNYYELLYAFHIYRHNYRKAGSVMFEYGMRLGREVRNSEGLQKQVNAYLACLNCLRLVRPKYAWIVQPASGAVYERAGASPKRNHDGESSVIPKSRQIDILELQDLEKEYVLAQTRLTLAVRDPSTAAVAGSASAEEIVSLLVQAGLFDTAISLCQTFKLSLMPVFEGLAYKCIKLQHSGEAAQVDAWQWLATNQLSTIVSTKETSATDESWRLLTSYLEKYEAQNGQYHRCIISKLLAHGLPLPSWLINSYKAIDAAELLRLYLNYDLLEEAADLVLEYVDALLGKGHQYFRIEKPLSATAPLVWLPYSAIDNLLQALAENKNNQHNADLLNKLNLKLDDYFEHLDRSTSLLSAIRRS